jgi:hypothetical protein
MTLREAASRTSRSITTLRRYIRSGRLHAEKHYGRFGPEYFVSERDLADAGLDRDPAPPGLALIPARPQPAPLDSPSPPPWDPRVLREIVPLALYQELQMKHEQLLVQYGMIRAGGLRAMELRAELEAREQRLERADAAVERLRRERDEALDRLGRQLREARFELEGRRIEIEALKSKVRSLEMLTRNQATGETIEQQLRRIREQTQRVEQASEEASRGEAGPSDH